MPEFHSKQYLPVKSYAEAQKTFHVTCGMLLHTFPPEASSTRDVIIRNFIARTDTMAAAIFHLWNISDYQDGWIIHRCLLDRLFHLNHLQEHDEFDVFEAWSFLEQYKAVNRVRSDADFNCEPRMFGVSEQQKQRARILEKNRPVWHRPKAEDVAKRMGLSFLYRFGYDSASHHVHPMANDGQQDFFTTTKLKPAPELPDQRSLLSNTLLAGTMIVQEGLNASTPSWHSIIYKLLNDLRQFLDAGADDYKVSFVEVGTLFREQQPLCEMREACPQSGATDDKG